MSVHLVRATTIADAMLVITAAGQEIDRLRAELEAAKARIKELERQLYEAEQR